MLFTNIYLYLFVVHVSNTSKFLSKYALFQKRSLRHWLFVNLFLFWKIEILEKIISQKTGSNLGNQKPFPKRKGQIWENKKTNQPINQPTNKHTTQAHKHTTQAHKHKHTAQAHTNKTNNKVTQQKTQKPHIYVSTDRRYIEMLCKSRSQLSFLFFCLIFCLISCFAPFFFALPLFS